MSYLVLARKSRPQTFDEVIGQAPIVTTLKNSLMRNRVAHALLFSGVRGVGKTTLARIMAKAINCENRESNPPCNECLSCKEITSGVSLDLYEIDGASNRGIQEIRELKEKIRFLPTSSKYRIIIIDEVHMLTNEAFNALLKTLEEPPEHVHFMFATTEIHKIPITILSRCQQYELKRVNANELGKHFKKLVEEDGKTIEQEALNLIVREAAGSVRDGLSLLDQILSFSETNITAEDAVEVLGLIDRQLLTSLTIALLEGDRGKAINTLEQIFSFGMDIRRFCTDLINQFRTLLFCKINDCRELIDLPEEDFQAHLEISKKYSTESLHLTMSILVEMVEDIGRSNQPRLVLETTFLKIMAAGNIVPIAEILAKVKQFSGSTQPNEQGKITAPAAPNNPQRPPVETRQPTQPTKKKISEPAVEKPVEKTIEKPPTKVPEPKVTKQAIIEEKPVKSVEETPQPQPEKLKSPSKPKDPPNRSGKGRIAKDWPKFIEYVQEELPWMAQALNHIDDIQEDDTEVKLHFDDTHHCTVIALPDKVAQLQEFIFDFFKVRIKINISAPESDGASGSKEGSMQAIRRELESHPLTIAAAEVFRGTIGETRPSLKKTK
ncbi:MAG: DNA polymerase III subunit gamma/tau [Desulfotalea sp.]